MQIPNKSKMDLLSKELLQIGITKGYIAVGSDKITYVAPGKKYNFNNPEEKIRAPFYVELIEKYRYQEKRIDTEVEVPRRTPSDRADIVIYEDDPQKRPYIVVECKKEGLTESEINQTIEQVFGNANSLRAKYAIVVAGSTRIAFDVAGFDPREREKNIISDIPIKYGNIVKFKYKKGDPEWDIKPTDLRRLQTILQQCHNILWQNGKRNPAEAFDDMSKLMFCKDKDERILTPIGEYYNFQIGTHETVKEVANRIKSIYYKSQEKDPRVFSAPIKVEDGIIYSVVEKLQGVSLSRTDLDSKGRAFETFLKRIFRGEMGQYFTPREIVNFMINILGPNADDTIIDPACGSGGFLLYSLDKIRQEAEKKFEPDNAKLLWRDFALNNLFGIEINSQLSRVSMMNMIIHEDGHSNIENSDSLDDISKFKARRNIKLNKYTLLLTNPPFGATIKEQERSYLVNYVLGSKINKRKQQQTQILFIERCLDFLKPGGRMGIVLPDGVLANPSTKYVREFILERANILAVISLPSHAFTPSGVPTINTSLLFLQKKQVGKESLNKNYPIFMGFAKNIGYEPNGKPSVKEDESTDLDKILECWKLYKKGISFSSEEVLLVNFEELQDRFDARYYWFTRELLKKKFARIKLGNIVQEIKDKIDPPDNPSNYYPILSVINEGLVLFNEERLGADIRQKYKLVKHNYIVYNPYRINVGSIGVVPKELDGMLVSPAYVVMKPKEVDPHFIVAILRHHFYRIYLEIMATGSIRNSVSFKIISNIEIPEPHKNIDLQKTIIAEIDKISLLKKEIKDEKNKIRSSINETLK